MTYYEERLKYWEELDQPAKPKIKIVDDSTYHNITFTPGHTYSGTTSGTFIPRIVSQTPTWGSPYNPSSSYIVKISDPNLTATNPTIVVN